MVLLRHHLKNSFTQNMRNMMEELGLLEEDCDHEADAALKKLLDKNKYEDQYRYPIWEAMQSHSTNIMTILVSVYCIRLGLVSFRNIFVYRAIRNRVFRIFSYIAIYENIDIFSGCVFTLAVKQEKARHQRHALQAIQARSWRQSEHSFNAEPRRQ